MNSQRPILLRSALLILFLVLPLHIGIGPASVSFANRFQALYCKSGRILPSPNPGQSNNILSGVAALSPQDVWAVGGDNGGTLVEHWDGTSVSVVSSPNPGVYANSLSGVSAVSPTDIWAVGTYYTSSSPIRSLIEHWDGTQWSVVASPNPGNGANNLLAVTAPSATDVWAVGTYTSFGPFINGTLVEHWDGNSWSVVPSPSPGKARYADNVLQSISAVSANDIWAVGYYGGDQPLTEHWNGTNWSVVPSPHVGRFSNYLRGVAAFSSQDVWAVGYFWYFPGDLRFTLTEHWNGTKWSIVFSPNPNQFTDDFEGVAAFSSQDVWAVGNDGNKGGSLIERWDGKQWKVIRSRSKSYGESSLLAIAADTPSDIWTVGFYVIKMGSISQTLVEQYCP